MLAMPSFLADIVQPSPSGTFPAQSAWESCLVARLAQLDELGILGKAARVKIERNPVPATNRAHLPRVLHRDRLAAA